MRYTNIEDLPGRLHATKHRNGDPTRVLNLKVTHQNAFHMQQFFEAQAVDSANFFDANEAFELAAILRNAVLDEQPE